MINMWMKMFLGKLVLLCMVLKTQQATTNNIVFDLADLTLDYETDEGWVTLEAFKSSLNDLIIEKNETWKFGQLNWLSVGNPKLVLSSIANKSSLFVFTPEGFYTKVDMLTNKQRSLFQEVVKRKYNIDVKLNQIVSLIPSRLDCHLTFYENDEKLLITGTVTELNTFPLRLFFTAPLKARERTMFELRLQQDKQDLDIEFICEVSSQGQAYKQNTLVITGQLISQLKLADKIFGDGSEAYVTRTQVAKLSSELYQTLSIIEQYQMPETQFSDAFITDFVKQTASTINQYTSIEDALAYLSPYNVLDDIQPNVIKSELSKLFTIVNRFSKEILTLNTTQYEKLKKFVETSGGMSIWGIFKLGFGADYVNKQSSEWETLNTLFYNQLNELNNYDQNDIEWERNGDIVQPKSIKVSLLKRINFQNNLIFTRVTREFYDAPYKRQFSLTTMNSLYPAYTVLDTVERIEQLEYLIKEEQQISTKLNATLDSTITRTTKLDNELNNKIQLVENTLKTRIDTLKISKVRVEKGLWRFQISVRGYPTYPVSALFNVTFERPPTLFFTQKSNHVGNNVAVLYSIINEKISTTGMNASVTFYGRSDVLELIIEWVAVGYVSPELSNI